MFKQARISNKQGKQLCYFVWQRETAVSSWFYSSRRMLKNWKKKSKLPIGRTRRAREGIWSLIKQRYKRTTSDWKLHLNEVRLEMRLLLFSDTWNHLTIAHFQIPRNVFNELGYVPNKCYISPWCICSEARI